MMSIGITELIAQSLNNLAIELPSWGFANTGTRFGKFVQAGAAKTIQEKIEDAAQVHALTGCCPKIAVHSSWDFPRGVESGRVISSQASKLGISIGSVNPTLFEEQIYKFGSLGNPDVRVREHSFDHIRQSIEIMRAVGSSDLVLWFADGSNYPGTANIRSRKKSFEDQLRRVAENLSGDERMLVEYKPFEPAFYHTDIADWGMAFLFARKAGERAKVLVDTGHHYQSQNVEQIVAWLLSEGMLGGFHFNDRRYADDDLTSGSVDPYQLFRIFYEIHYCEWQTGERPAISYMVDQSHNLKNKIEAMIQTVMTVQEIFAKAAIIDFEALEIHQQKCSLIEAEECLRTAFRTDVTPEIEEWRVARGLPSDPLASFRDSGYLEKVEKERSGRTQDQPSSYA